MSGGETWKAFSPLAVGLRLVYWFNHELICRYDDVIRFFSENCARLWTDYMAQKQWNAGI